MDGGEEKRETHRQTTEEPLITVEEPEYTTLNYRLESSPPFFVTLFTAFQHILITLPGCLYTAAVVSDVACAPQSHPIRATLFSGTLFMSGFGTLVQTMFGIRLPIVQGPSAAFIVPLISLASDPEWKCTDEQLYPKEHSTNVTHSTLDIDDYVTAEIYVKLRKMSGALMLASLFEIFMGSVGLLGLLLRFIGPITVATTITLIGISVSAIPIAYARPSFPVALGTMFLIVIFVLYCRDVSIPIPRCGGKAKEGKNKRSFPVFQLIPILIAVAIMWILSFVLTARGVFSDDTSSVDYLARTDAKAKLITDSPWFQLTYPGMFGQPKVNIALSLGFAISCMASMVESVGDYYAAHKACEVCTPPNHAISRGVFVEGIGTLVSGAVGVGHATTSYSGNISVITLSKNASRHVMYAVAAVVMLVSVVGKVGAALTAIPNPILGGVSLVIVATLVSIGLSNLRDVDMTSTRNLLVVGLPFISGLTVPACLEKYPGIMDTGIEQLDQVLHVIFGNPMFLGGILATLLDNTVPGSYQSRGMIDPHTMTPFSKRHDVAQDVYGWWIYPKIVSIFPFLNYLPFLPHTIQHRDVMMEKVGVV